MAKKRERGTVRGKEIHCITSLVLRVLLIEQQTQAPRERTRNSQKKKCKGGVRLDNPKKKGTTKTVLSCLISRSPTGPDYAITGQEVKSQRRKKISQGMGGDPLLRQFLNRGEKEEKEVLGQKGSGSKISVKGIAQRTTACLVGVFPVC